MTLQSVHTRALQRDKERSRQCDSEAFHISGPVGGVGGGGETKRPSLKEAATHAADILRGRRLAGRPAGLHLTPSTFNCCVVVMESSTNTAEK